MHLYQFLILFGYIVFISGVQITIERAFQGDVFSGLPGDCSTFNAISLEGKCICGQGGKHGTFLSNQNDKYQCFYSQVSASGCEMEISPKSGKLRTLVKPITDYIGVFALTADTKEIKAINTEIWNGLYWEGATTANLRVTPSTESSDVTLNWSAQPVNIPWQQLKGHLTRINIRIQKLDNSFTTGCIAFKFAGIRTYDTDSIPSTTASNITTVTMVTTTLTTTSTTLVSTNTKDTTVTTTISSTMTTDSLPLSKDDGGSNSTVIIVVVVLVLLLIIILLVIVYICYRKKKLQKPILCLSLPSFFKFKSTKKHKKASKMPSSNIVSNHFTTLNAKSFYDPPTTAVPSSEYEQPTFVIETKGDVKDVIKNSKRARDKDPVRMSDLFYVGTVKNAVPNDYSTPRSSSITIVKEEGIYDPLSVVTEEEEPNHYVTEAPYVKKDTIYDPVQVDNVEQQENHYDTAQVDDPCIENIYDDVQKDEAKTENIQQKTPEQEVIYQSLRGALDSESYIDDKDINVEDAIARYTPNRLRKHRQSLAQLVPNEELQDDDE